MSGEEFPIAHRAQARATAASAAGSREGCHDAALNSTALPTVSANQTAATAERRIRDDRDDRDVRDDRYVRDDRDNRDDRDDRFESAGPGGDEWGAEPEAACVLARHDPRAQFGPAG